MLLFLSQSWPTTNALKLTNSNEHKASANGIFGKMIEMSTAGESEEKERHAASVRKAQQLAEAEKEHDRLVAEEEAEERAAQAKAE